MIPGIRPGNSTINYLTSIVNPLIFIGTTWLLFIITIPIIANGTTNASVSFGGTSIIIVVGVIVESITQLESSLINYVAGHDAAIREAGRITDGWTDIADSGNEELNRKMELLLSKLSEHPMVTIEYFLPDQHKSGGSYHTISGNVRRIDEYERIIELMDRQKIPIDFIRNLTL